MFLKSKILISFILLNLFLINSSQSQSLVDVNSYTVSVTGVWYNLNIRTCGGFIISPKWIITEAFCGETAFQWIIQPISMNLNEFIRESRVFIQHPDFVLHSFLNSNVGLIFLTEPLEFNDNLKSIQLPWYYENNAFYDVDLNYVSLRNLTNDVFSLEIVINQLKVVNDQKICRYRSEICTLGTESNPNQEPCDTLFGGGLIYINENMEHILIGVETLKQCNATTPSTFSRIAWYLDWIKDVTLEFD